MTKKEIRNQKLQTLKGNISNSKQNVLTTQFGAKTQHDLIKELYYTTSSSKYNTHLIYSDFKKGSAELEGFFNYFRNVYIAQRKGIVIEDGSILKDRPHAFKPLTFDSKGRKKYIQIKKDPRRKNSWGVSVKNKIVNVEKVVDGVKVIVQDKVPIHKKIDKGQEADIKLLDILKKELFFKPKKPTKKPTKKNPPVRRVLKKEEVKISRANLRIILVKRRQSFIENKDLLKITQEEYIEVLYYAPDTPHSLHYYDFRRVYYEEKEKF